MKSTATPTQRGLAGITTLAVLAAQMALPTRTEASHLGSATASAGSAPPPSVSAVQSFQPDLFIGRATTAIPLAVPPGRKGLQPSLALSYSSSGRNGWLGVGWSLDVGSIERSTKHGVPTYDSSDTFSFLFQGVASDLVKIPDGTYRAKDEGAFLRVEHKGVSGWEVRDKSGTRYLFGQTVASQIESTGHAFRWALDQVIDPHGNTLTVTYTKDQQQLYPSRIAYTGHAPTGLPPSHQVDFILEDRPDLETSYRSGFAVTTAKRLKTVEAKATVGTSLQLARRYELSYIPSPRTGRSLLTTVTQVGTDGTTSLPPTTFSYQDGGTPSYSLLSNPSTKPQLSGDVDGNGTSDLLAFEGATGTWSVSCTHNCTVELHGVWLSGFGTTSSIPVVGDWNSDGKADVAIVDPAGTWQFATSTGTSFQASTISSISLGAGTPFTGDFNGDGKTDTGVYANGAWTIALSTGSGFSQAGALSLTWGGSNTEPLTGDFNGDGLTDLALIDKSTGNVDVRCSTGSSWTAPTPNALTGFGAGKTHTSADFDGDGLSDVAYYNTGTGQVFTALSRGSSFTLVSAPLPVTFSQTSANDELQVADFNGDGIADPGVFNLLSGQSQLAFSQGNLPDELITIANGIGGSTTLTYQLSNILLTTKLPFVTSVIQKITASDGLGHSYTTTYTYEGGLYDAPTKEFRGFATAKVIDAENNVALTQFHQDEHKKGRAFHTELRDAVGNLWTKTDQTWSDTDPYPGIHFTKLDQTDAFIYDGDSTFKQTRSRFQYDSYGNLIRSDDDGEVSVAGDERATITAFLYNPTAWILNRPSLTQTLDASSVLVAQRRFFYDGATSSTTPSTTGNLTTEEEWLNLPTEQWLATSLAYDNYGNVTTVTDALNRTTTNTYDPLGTYLIQIHNVLGHTRSLTYDPRLGQVTASTDQNGQTTTTEYDPLGRVTNVIGPTDTSALPTISYAYDLSTVPAKTTVTTRVQSGGTQTLTVSTFTDGLGRTIQTRSPAEDPTKQVVTGVVAFDTRGLVTKQWLPYLSTLSSSYVPFTLEPSASSLAVVQYTYDPLGRPLTITDPDGSVTSTRYNDWAVTVTDANGHTTTRTTDAYGWLLKVEEFNGTAVYTTTYQYDAKNNLTKVTDHWGHVTTLTYDSLNRKLSMDDPDMGHWTYAYDAVDNLTRQTDARGVTISFTYDALNRLTQKSYSVTQSPSHPVTLPAPVTYTYDNPAKPFSKGKLTEITDGSGSSSFEYDSLGRLSTETKTIDGQPSTVHRTYDLLGRLLTLTYPDGSVATYTYNAQGGIETIDLLDAVTQALSHPVTDVAYNAAGQLTKLVYGNGTISDYTYNPQTLRLDQLKTTGPTGTLQDFSYGFDSVGNVTGITDRVHTGTQTFQYDALNRLTQAAGSYGTSTYAYDPIGNMTSKEGVTMTYGAGSAGPHAVTSTSDGWTMTYDANGNLLVKDFTPSPSHAVTQSLFSYDAENRLTEVQTAPEETVTLRFEPGWNFFSLPVIPDDLHITALFPTFAADFEQLSWFEAAFSTPDTQRFQSFVNHPKFNDFDTLAYGQGYQLYCKNPAGVTVTFKGKLPTQQASTTLLPGWHLLPAMALDSKPISWLTAGLDADQVLVYDAVTQTLKPPTETTVGQAYFVHVVTTSLFTPSLPRDPTTRFVYDGDGGKVKQITASGTTTLLGEVFEKAPSGTTTKYVFAGAERICAVVRGPSTVDYRYYHGDHLGSTNLVTDGTGQVVELAEYTPYGSLAAHSGSADVAHKFTGQRQDVTHGLILFPGRVYDPALGRFLQADPFVQDPADPQMLNRYSYVRNNPLAFTDPSGYKKKRSFFRVLFAVIAAVVVTVATGGHAELGAQIFSAIVVATAAAVGDQVGAAVDRASSNSSPSPSTAEAASPRGPPSPSPAAAPAPLGHAASFIGPVRYTDADDGSISDRKLLAKRYRQDLKLIRALSLKASDRFRATVGARPIEGIGAGHRYIAAPNGNRFEMGPLLRQGRPIVTSNTTDVSTWDTSLTTQSAIAAGLATTATANVSASGFVTSMGLYEAYFGGQQYNALSYNSNFAVNSVIYGAGGPEVKNLGYTPGFPDN